MSDVRLEVYLYFKGNAREAMEFYKTVFGGELNMQAFSDTPADARPPGMTDDMNDWLMHAMLTGGDVKLMASDSANASDKAAKIDLSLGGKDENRLREIFAALSEGGSIYQELTKMFWGDIFGSLTDKFGVNWMVNIEGESQA